MVAAKKPKKDKKSALQRTGTLNPKPERVKDELFDSEEFFDPKDLLQVKYEMLRRVLSENASVTDAAKEYGVSRPTYYQAQASLGKAGIAGLVPKKRGPRQRRKIRGDVLAFIENKIVQGEPIRARQLSISIQQKFKLKIHPRTIERALAGKKTPR